MLSMKHQIFTCPTEHRDPMRNMSSNQPTHPQVLNKRNKDKIKRRFHEDQIRSLEGTFESDSRPDSCLKHRLAYRLALQPRQVSTWFQNKRARLKSKEIERECSALRTKYEDLKSSFESLKREHDELFVQLQELKIVHGELNGTMQLRAEDRAKKESEPRPDGIGNAERLQNEFSMEHIEQPGRISFASSGSWDRPDYVLDESSSNLNWWGLWS